MNHTLQQHEDFIENEVLIYNDTHVNLILCCCHNVFEVMVPPVYQVCFECRHVYQTREDLERAYAEVTEQIDGKAQHKPASEIFFCQECLHDF